MKKITKRQEKQQLVKESILNKHQFKAHQRRKRGLHPGSRKQT